MKKHFIALLALFFITMSTVFGQVLNASFEDWSNGPTASPDNWLSNNFGSSSPITQSPVAHSGSHAVKGAVLAGGQFGEGNPPVLQAGQDGGGFSIDSRPAALHGFYVFVPIAGFFSDSLSIRVTVLKDDDTVGAGHSLIGTSINSYEEFVTDIHYVSDSTPNLISIAITIGSMGFASEGSWFLIDDLSFGPAVGVQDRKDGIPGGYTLSQNYPNPFNPTTTIDFALPHAGFTTLTIFDVLGKEITKLVDGELTAGQHSVSWSVPQAGIASGTYYYQLRSGEYLQTRKLILAK